MKSAGSILFDGLIEAKDCSYLAYKKLLLRCPVCGQPVFLASGKIKAPHFKHFKDPDRQCELRTTTQGVLQASTKTKGQRHKFFLEHFWEIVKGCMTGLLIEECDQYIRNLPEQEKIVASSRVWFFGIARCDSLIDEILDFHLKGLQATASGKTHYRGTPERLEEIQSFLSGLSLELQKKSVTSAARFLGAKRSRNILDRLARYGLYNWLCYCHREEPGFFDYRHAPEVTGFWIAMDVLALLCAIPWQEAGGAAILGEKLPRGIMTRARINPSHPKMAEFIRSVASRI